MWTALARTQKWFSSSLTLAWVEPCSPWLRTPGIQGKLCHRCPRYLCRSRCLLLTRPPPSPARARSRTCARAVAYPSSLASAPARPAQQLRQAPPDGSHDPRKRQCNTRYATLSPRRRHNAGGCRWCCSARLCCRCRVACHIGQRANASCGDPRAACLRPHARCVSSVEAAAAARRYGANQGSQPLGWRA